MASKPLEEYTPYPECISFSPDGGRIMLVSSSEIKTLEVTSGKLVSTVGLPLSAGSTALSAEADRQRLAVGLRRFNQRSFTSRSVKTRLDPSSIVPTAFDLLHSPWMVHTSFPVPKTGQYKCGTCQLQYRQSC